MSKSKAKSKLCKKCEGKILTCEHSSGKDCQFCPGLLSLKGHCIFCMFDKGEYTGYWDDLDDMEGILKEIPLQVIER
jgi:hypothetical protein